MTTQLRDLNSNPKDILNNPGPGQYDLNFRDELKILDHKLSSRYKKTGFGVSSPKFIQQDKKGIIKTERNIINESNQLQAEANGKEFGKLTL